MRNRTLDSFTELLFIYILCWIKPSSAGVIIKGSRNESPGRILAFFMPGTVQEQSVDISDKFKVSSPTFLIQILPLKVLLKDIFPRLIMRSL